MGFWSQRQLDSSMADVKYPWEVSMVSCHGIRLKRGREVIEKLRTLLKSIN
jgi:hypothetical protein